MINLNSHTQVKPYELLGYLVGLAVLLVALISSAVGQTSQMATDGHTPSGLAPGSPSGSYALSGYDNINPYNGGLNFRLPLMQVGGRGNAAYTMQLPIEQKWLAKYSEIYNPEPEQAWQFWDASFNWWGGIKPGYGPGVLQGRSTGLGQQPCYLLPQRTTYYQSLTRLTFTTPDGTEYEFIDKDHEGQPLDVSYCTDTGNSRGTVFVTTDGTSATFISDDPISDEIEPSGDGFLPSGVMILRDGTRYRINGGTVASITDRQGNKTTLVYTSYARPTLITDSLGRQIEIEYDVNDVAPYGLCDRITYYGFGNLPHQIRISKKNLGNALRTGFQLRTYRNLFPELINTSTTTNHNPTVVSSVWLPDGRSYKFFYNSFSELARVELPTGGATEYDWEAGAGNDYASGVLHVNSSGIPSSDSQIYRRIVQRRVYSDGVNIESTMTISKPETRSGDVYINAGFVSIQQFGQGSTPLSITKHYYYGSPVYSMSNENPISYTPWKEGKEYQTEMLDSNGTSVLRRVQNVWQQCEQCEINMNWVPLPYEDAPSNNPQIVSTTTALLDGANQVSKQTFKYDKYNNLTDTWDYDYGAGNAPTYPTRRSHTDYLVANNNGDYTGTAIHIRNLPISTWVKVVDPNSGIEATNPSAKGELAYDETTYPVIEYGAVTGWSSPVGGVARGNVTTTKNWKDISSNLFVTTHARYDQLGNIRKSWNGLGKLSQVEYSSSYLHAFPTKTISPPVPNPANPNGPTITFETTSDYDLFSGLLTSTTDANNQTTHVEYNDVLDRPTRVIPPAGGGQTIFEYGDNVGDLYVRVQTAFDASRTLESRQYFDGLGRSVRAYKSEGASWLVSDTQYDGIGRVWRVSNPYRTTGLGGAINPSGIWTTTQYDALGRASALTLPDGASVTTVFNGSTTTVTAPQGKNRRTVTDGLGRLVQVIENPGGVNYQTNYIYDAPGNLRKVVQGDQQRYFMYDALSRLIRTKMPEQQVNTNLSVTDSVTGNVGWSLGYTYDDGGNLLTRTDARNVTSTFEYDALSRNTTVRYSDSTPGINQYYDGATNGKGKAWISETLGNAGSLTTIDGYDALGRPLVQRQQFKSGSAWSQSYTAQKSYGLSGQLLSQTYPSGHTTSHLYDDGGRPLSFSGNLGDGVQRAYSSAMNYDNAGRMQEEKYGTLTPLYQKLRYNVRSQLYDVRLSTMSRASSETDWNRGCLAFYYSNLNPTWGESASDNNGNLLKSENYVPNANGSYNMVQDRYEYDPLNRLLSMSEYQNGQGSMAFKQAYSYDHYGNRTIDQTNSSNTTGINRMPVAVDALTNRLGVPTGLSGTISYDAAGNLTTDTYSGGGSRTYDAENRMVTATNSGSQLNKYTYDAQGHRVRRETAEGEVWQVFGINGELLAEYNPNAAPFLVSKEYGYRAGQLLVTASNGDDQRLQRFVNQLYRGALGRDADKTELNDRVNALAAAGALGQSQLLTAAKNIALELFTSQEYEDRRRIDEQYVSDLYWTYFERSADVYTVAYWVGRLQSSGSDQVSREQLQTICEQWGEFSTIVSALWGANTTGENERTEHFLWNVYLGAVGAVPGPSDMQSQIDALNTASAQGKEAVITSAEQICRAMMTSSQYENRGRSDEEFVSDLFEVFWQRTPDADSWSEWTQAVANDGRASVLDTFAQSKAFRDVAGALYRETLWLIPDQLGSPRMIAERTGSLAGIKRHDYLPFGEEIVAGLAGRTTQQGYVTDSVRQQFTGQERDDETGLDYFNARYHSSMQGRFTSVDPMMASAHAANPQSWNRYSYTLNNPLRYVDPTGMRATTPSASGTAGDVAREEYELQEGQDPPPQDMEVVKVDTDVNDKAPSILDFDTNYLDKTELGAVPIGGKFQISYKYLINKPVEGTRPEDYGSLEAVDKKQGVGNDVKLVRPEAGGTFADANHLEAVGPAVVRVTGAKNEAVIVEKTETFIVKARPYMGRGTSGAINYKIVVRDPVVTEGITNAPQKTVSRSSTDDRSTGKVPKYIEIRKPFK